MSSSSLETNIDRDEEWFLQILKVSRQVLFLSEKVFAEKTLSLQFQYSVCFYMVARAKEVYLYKMS